MKVVTPKVFLIAETMLNRLNLEDYLDHIKVSRNRRAILDPDKSGAYADSEELIEVMGRICYRSWEPGLNPNVTKVRDGNRDYIKNIIESGHGSCLEHASVSFIFADVSRVLTHELTRHRAGVAISQESLRYVRLDTLSAYVPLSIQENEDSLKLFFSSFEAMEQWQKEMAQVHDINSKNFSEKKKITSAMRRIAPMGLATTIGWTANFRTIRHVLEMRTHPSAEEEIRLTFAEVGDIMLHRYPNLFQDYTKEVVDGIAWFKTENRKV